MLNTDTFRHLLIMAAADGRVDRTELELLRDSAIRLGITDDQFEAAIDRATTPVEEIELKVPTAPEEKRELLIQLVCMMGVDGVLDEREKSLFAIIAAQMGTSAEQVDEVINEALRQSHGDV